MKSIPPIFLVLSPAMTKHSARQMLCVVRHGDSFRQKRTDWTVPLMWIFGFSGNETEGLEWASSGFRRGPRLCGAPSELATTHSLSVPLILMHLAEALRFVSPREGSPARSKQHVAEAHTHTPGWRKESHRLSSTQGAADTALPPETIGSPGQRVISIRALFHPKPVLLFLDVKLTSSQPVLWKKSFIIFFSQYEKKQWISPSVGF